MGNLSEKIWDGINLLAWTGAFAALCFGAAGYDIEGENCQSYHKQRDYVKQTLSKKEAIEYHKQLNCGELEKLTKDCYRRKGK